MVDGPEDEDVIVVEDSSSPEVDNSETVVEAPDAVVDASPTIIVETGDGDNSASDGEIERAVDTATRLTALEGAVGAVVNELSELTGRLAETAFRQEMVEETIADQAVEQEVMAEAVAETVEEDLDLEPDQEPSTAGRHWFFKSFNELRGNRS